MLEFLWGAIATALSVLYTAIFGLMAACAAMLGRPHAVSLITRLWARFILTTCGVKVTIAGLEHLAGLGPCVLVSNHQSFFDIFAICALLPGDPRFVAKQELGKIPVIGYTMRRGGHIMIDRAQGGQAIRRAVKIARAGYSIVVFAEGTRFSDNRVHPFNDGAAWLAIATGRKCVPMAVSGTAGFFPRGARVVRPGRRMRIDIGAPIDTAGMRSADREPMTRELEARVRALFRSEV
ncbi:MAG TPA: lysophospholipid acyltransferase family protein [Candidatus Binataceae bacterium]|nr:lysophospholipid acyltransferase family protein [Candidatus Binataceae bacterium]